MDGYGAGISINAVAIEDAAPPREVADAFDEVQRAEQDEDRFVQEANQYANQKLGARAVRPAQISKKRTPISRASLTRHRVKRSVLFRSMTNIARRLM